MEGKKIVMSGMRPTGRLHLGNYWGALRNWLDLQKEYECYFMVADLHMFTTGYEETSRLKADAREMTLDWLAAGLDPARCTIFQQSQVSQHAELALLLSMITPISWLENNPTYKEQLQELGRTKLSKAVEGSAGEPMDGEPSSRRELRTHGFLGYPVLQAADIALYGARFVPVGQDQAAHVEMSREIVRRFNSLFGPVLAEPATLLTSTPKVPGLDGRKMSKSYGNALDLWETPESLSRKVMTMYTDPLKARAKDPGHPEGCVVFAMHKLYSGHASRREAECREGAIGCVACKKDLVASMQGPYDAFRKARERYVNEGLAEEVLRQGSLKAREVAEGTMARVREAMNLR